MLKMDTAHSSETPVLMYQTQWLHVARDHNPEVLVTALPQRELKFFAMNMAYSELHRATKREYIDIFSKIRCVCEPCIIFSDIVYRFAVTIVVIIHEV
jgi:hypothetical protein